jgi:hypothetical protein
MKIAFINIFAFFACASLFAREERDWLGPEAWDNQELLYSHGMKTIQVDDVEDYDFTVTYALDGGRFGDQLLGYLKALWISYKYHIPFLFRPFDKSDQLALSDFHQIRFSEEKVCSFDAKLEYFFPTEMALDKSAKVFQYLGQKPDHQKGEKKKLIWNVGLLTPFIEEHFCEKLDDEGFRALMGQLIVPKKQFELLQFPAGYKTIAIHVRTGVGFDWEINIRNMPTKFPPDTFYLGSLKHAAAFFDKEPLYIYIFTDHPRPVSILENFRKEIESWHLENKIVLDCRKEGNHHTVNVLEDLFFMTRFDCIIHGDSSYSLTAALLSAPILEFRPSHWGELRKDRMGNPLLDKNSQHIVDPLIVVRRAKGKSISYKKIMPVEDSIL